MSNSLQWATLPVKRLRFDGAKAEFLLPAPEADFLNYLRRLEEEAIFPAQQESLQRLKALRHTEPALDAEESFSRGMKDPLIWMLQAALNRLSELHQLSDIYCQDADGDFGEITDGAVRAYQTRRNLVVDGVAGPQTLGALSSELKEQGLTAISLKRADLPRVGIMLSDPRELIPGEDWETNHMIDLLIQMGCEPVLIPPCADRAISLSEAGPGSAIQQMAGGLDGILGPGGDDVDPSIYGEDNQFARGTNVQRDRFEAEFVRACLQSRMFMFGICRSHQMWNAAAGGSLVQDVQAEGFSQISQSQGDFQLDGSAPFVVRDEQGNIRFENRVWLEKDSQIARVLDGIESILTNSYHHQAVDVPGEGFRIVGRVWDDHTKRHTIEVTERWNAITTQFHPEAMQRDPNQRELLETLGRRALIFSLLKRGEPSLSGLLSRIQQFPKNIFDPSDVDWVKAELAPRLG